MRRRRGISQITMMNLTSNRPLETPAYIAPLHITSTLTRQTARRRDLVLQDRLRALLPQQEAKHRRQPLQAPRGVDELSRLLVRLTYVCAIFVMLDASCPSTSPFQ